MIQILQAAHISTKEVMSSFTKPTLTISTILAMIPIRQPSKISSNRSQKRAGLQKETVSKKGGLNSSCKIVSILKGLSDTLLSIKILFEPLRLAIFQCATRPYLESMTKLSQEACLNSPEWSVKLISACIFSMATSIVWYPLPTLSKT